MPMNNERLYCVHIKRPNPHFIPNSNENEKKMKANRANQNAMKGDRNLLNGLWDEILKCGNVGCFTKNNKTELDTEAFLSRQTIIIDHKNRNK